MKFQKLFLGLSVISLTATAIDTTQAAPQNPSEYTATVKPTLTIAQESPPAKRIQFAKGSSSGTVSGAVVRGTRDTYMIGAGLGQKMTVTITSEEKNAAFDILDPSGGKIAEEITDQQVIDVLPLAGDYQIVVSPTRGNATYKMTVSITGRVRR
ncbi:MAG TPA: hypothetical protein V6C90_22065 [Coleofasciculaceae cyanobacterium]|jgi:hypothetical protein